MESRDYSVVVIADMVDVDNLALAQISAHPRLAADAYVVDSRPIFDDDRRLDTGLSAECLRLNTARLKGFLWRLGCDATVFEGSIVPFSPVPSDIHVDERIFDIYGDEAAGYEIGNFDDATQYIKQLPGQLHIISGGPLTDVAKWLGDPDLQPRFGYLTAQLGTEIEKLDGMSAHVAGENYQFNSACDPEAAYKVLRDYPGEIFAISKNTTKHPQHGFQSPGELAALGLYPELVELYRIGFPYLRDPRHGLVFMHDAYPGWIMDTLLNDPHLRGEVTHRPGGEIRGTMYRHMHTTDLILGEVHRPDGRERLSSASIAPNPAHGPRNLIVAAATLQSEYHDMVNFLGTDEARQSVNTKDGSITNVIQVPVSDDMRRLVDRLCADLVGNEAATDEMYATYNRELDELKHREQIAAQRQTFVEQSERSDRLNNAIEDFTRAEYKGDSTAAVVEGFAAESAVSTDDLAVVAEAFADDNKSLVGLMTAMLIASSRVEFGPVLDGIRKLGGALDISTSDLESLVDQIFEQVFAKVPMTPYEATRILLTRSYWSKDKFHRRTFKQDR